jgi:hypothetical protein
MTEQIFAATRVAKVLQIYPSVRDAEESFRHRRTASA